MSTPERRPQTDQLPTVDGALANAVRLLYAAEIETDLKKMERLEKLADSWLGFASLMMRAEATED